VSSPPIWHAGFIRIIVLAVHREGRAAGNRRDPWRYRMRSARESQTNMGGQATSPQVADIARCALCRRFAVLRRSHIVPELLHRPIYDDKHQLEVVRHGAIRATTLRRGFREPLLCDSCEQHIKKFEDYLAAPWFSHAARDRELSDSVIIRARFDYIRLKLFVLSILWRASVSHLADFSDVRLGPHEERMRRLTNPDRRRSTCQRVPAVCGAYLRCHD
jgi:hypothetical protein